LQKEDEDGEGEEFFEHMLGLSIEYSILFQIPYDICLSLPFLNSR
jgi:hypothetical protein